MGTLSPPPPATRVHFDSWGAVMNYFLHLKSYFRKIIKLSVLENAALLRCSSEIRRLGHFHSVLGELG